MSEVTKDTPAGVIGDDIAFFGAITASVTHELNNVLSIIDQTAGLLDDLLAGAKRGKPISEEKLQQLADKVSKQTARGFDFIRHLNKFAHQADEPILEFEVRTVIENLCYLVKRYAVLKRVEFSQQIEDDHTQITSSPFQLQQAIYLVVRSLLSLAESGDTMMIQYNVVDTKPVVEVHFSKPADEFMADLKTGIETYLKLSDWEITIDNSNDKAVFKLVYTSQSA